MLAELTCDKERDLLTFKSGRSIVPDSEEALDHERIRRRFEKRGKITVPKIYFVTTPARRKRYKERVERAY